MITSMISSVPSLFCLAQLVADQNKKSSISDRFGYGILYCTSDDDDDDSDSDPDPDDILHDMFPDEDDDYWTGEYDV